jgi:hypothetical protein
MPDFESRLVSAFEDSVVKMVRDGGFVQPNYEARMKIDPAFIRACYDKIDKARVIALVVERGEEHMANAIFNGMATELTSDVKRILSNVELREDIRAIIRTRIREAASALGGINA